VIAAIGQATKVQELVDGRVPNFLPLGESLSLTRWQTIQVNERTFETSVDGLFSGGDVVTGAATASRRSPRPQGRPRDRPLRRDRPRPSPSRWRSSARRTRTGRSPRTTCPRARATPSLDALAHPAERTASFAEVELGYTREDLKKESHRCLECGCQALFSCDLRRYATEYGADIQTFMARRASTRWTARTR